MKFNRKELQILSVVIAAWGLIFVTSGAVMNQSQKVVTKNIYTVDVATKQISMVQAKKNEVILKDLTINEGTPISMNIKDYLENPEQISDTMFFLFMLMAMCISLRNTVQDMQILSVTEALRSLSTSDISQTSLHVRDLVSSHSLHLSLLRQAAA